MNVLSLSTVVTAACSDVGVPCKISASTRTRPRPPKPPQYFLTPIPPSPPCAVTDNWPVKSFMAWHWYSQIKSQSIDTVRSNHRVSLLSDINGASYTDILSVSCKSMMLLQHFIGVVGLWKGRTEGRNDNWTSVLTYNRFTIQLNTNRRIIPPKYHWLLQFLVQPGLLENGLLFVIWS